MGITEGMYWVPGTSPHSGTDRSLSTTRLTTPTPLIVTGFTVVYDVLGETGRTEDKKRTTKSRRDFLNFVLLISNGVYMYIHLILHTTGRYISISVSMM